MRYASETATRFVHVYKSVKVVQYCIDKQYYTSYNIVRTKILLEKIYYRSIQQFLQSKRDETNERRGGRWAAAGENDERGKGKTSCTE